MSVSIVQSQSPVAYVAEDSNVSPGIDKQKAESTLNRAVEAGVLSQQEADTVSNWAESKGVYSTAGLADRVVFMTIDLAIEQRASLDVTMVNLADLKLKLSNSAAEEKFKAALVQMIGTVVAVGAGLGVSGVMYKRSEATRLENQRLMNSGKVTNPAELPSPSGDTYTLVTALQLTKEVFQGVFGVPVAAIQEDASYDENLAGRVGEASQQIAQGRQNPSDLAMKWLG